jgi:hypothetical protein
MNILKDRSAQQHLDQQGYVVIDMLGPEKLQELLLVFSQFRPMLPAKNGLHITLEHAEAQTRMRVAHTLIGMMRAQFDEHFHEYRVFQGSFIFKESNREDNPVPLHQDWTFVDEPSGQESYTIWVALCDITDETGAVGVMPGSHRDLDQIRYTPNEKYTGYEKIPAYASDRPVSYIRMKAGQALLWNHKLVHNSLPNISDVERRNASFCITGASAQLKSFWCSPEHGQVVDFDVPDDFYFTINSKAFLNAYEHGTDPVTHHSKQT